jgi:hypothetical protein
MEEVSLIPCLSRGRDRPSAPQGHDTKEHVMMPVEFDVAGKDVFITWTLHGIGKGIDEVLAEVGADIAFNP